jgi:hypothetical protein
VLPNLPQPTPQVTSAACCAVRIGQAIPSPLTSPPPSTQVYLQPTSVSLLPFFPPLLPADGFVGLLGGMKRGAIGLVVLPLASLLEMCASTADSIRRAVAGSSNVGWVRPPRWVSWAGWVGGL